MLFIDCGACCVLVVVCCLLCVVCCVIVYRCVLRARC